MDSSSFEATRRSDRESAKRTTSAGDAYDTSKARLSLGRRFLPALSTLPLNGAREPRPIVGVSSLCTSAGVATRRRHTNLERAEFSPAEIGKLYRLRWQIELLFKECKSHANLHRFDTEQSAIAEGLIWASMLVVVLKRAITHAAQLAIGIELSTQRAASCAKHVLDDILRSLLHDVGKLAGAISRACIFLGENSRRAHPKRDRLRGRLSSGLVPLGTRSANSSSDSDPGSASRFRIGLRRPVAGVRTRAPATGARPPGSESARGAPIAALRNRNRRAEPGSLLCA